MFAEIPELCNEMIEVGFAPAEVESEWHSIKIRLMLSEMRDVPFSDRITAIAEETGYDLLVVQRIAFRWKLEQAIACLVGEYRDRKELYADAEAAIELWQLRNKK